MMKKGFSLIEIIIALMIVGIVAAGALGGFRYLNKAKISKSKSNLNALRLNITQFQTDTGTYPTSLNDLAVRPMDEKIRSRWEGPYADENSLKDAWANEFVYQLSRGGQHPYELYSWGANGEGAPQEEWLDAWNI